MELTIDQVAKAVALARIRVEKDELPTLSQELSGILHWIDQLEKVDVQGVEIYTDYQSQSLSERDDVVTDGNCIDAVLSNAPEKAHNMFSVPKVVE